MFEDIEFKLKDKCYMNIESYKPKKLFLNPKIYNRIFPMIDGDEENEIEITGSDDLIYKVSPEIYNNNFIEKTSDDQDTSGSNISELKNIAIDLAKNANPDYYIYIDNKAFIDKATIITDLINIMKTNNKSVITPKLGMAGGQPVANFLE